MRHYRLLDDDLLLALAFMFAAMECSGIPPPQLFAFLVPQLEKPTGGLQANRVGVIFLQVVGKAEEAAVRQVGVGE
eukprot:1540748-Alexandrium_andersonii.AAC.1